jgi:multidrug efflux system membrane fusion protein
MKGSNKSRWAIAAGIIVVVLAAAWYWHSQSANGAPAGAKPATAPRGGGRHGMRGGALAPVQAATAVNKAVPRYLTGWEPLRRPTPSRCAAASTVS